MTGFLLVGAAFLAAVLAICIVAAAESGLHGHFTGSEAIFLPKRAPPISQMFKPSSRGMRCRFATSVDAVVVRDQLAERLQSPGGSVERSALAGGKQAYGGDQVATSAPPLIRQSHRFLGEEVQGGIE